MPKHYTRTIYMNKQTDIDWETAKIKWSSIEILHKGLDWCLSQMPKPREKIITTAKNIIKNNA